MKKLGWVILVGLMAGCAGSPVRTAIDADNARQTYMTSLTAYKDCVRSRGADRRQDEKAMMDVDERAFMNANSMRPGVGRAVSVTSPAK
jgi:hypothetical protein